MPEKVALLIRRLPPALKPKIRAALDAIVSNPHLGKPLRAELTSLWSLRVGRVRIIYRIHSHHLDIVSILSRSGRERRFTTV